MSTVTLFADGLYSKWGFVDGDILDDAFFDMNLDRDVHEHDVLVQLVEDKLLPILPHQVKTYRISTCHNPIRVEDEHLDDGSQQANADTSVTVTYDEIRQYAEKVLLEEAGIIEQDMAVVPDHTALPAPDAKLEAP